MGATKTCEFVGREYGGPGCWGHRTHFAPLDGSKRMFANGSNVIPMIRGNEDGHDTGFEASDAVGEKLVVGRQYVVMRRKVSGRILLFAEPILTASEVIGNRRVADVGVGA